MTKKEVVAILEEIGTILDLKGENPFKSRAYFTAARAIETQVDDITEMVKSGEISDVRGIGKAISEKLTILIETGRLPYYDDLKNSIPAGLLDMLEIPGMGPKKVKAVYEKLHVTSIGELEYACAENRLRDLEGFGQKSQDKIFEGIQLRKKYRERFHFHIAMMEAETIGEYLKKNSMINRMEFAGSLRRKKETIKDIDFVASCLDKDRKSIMDYFVNYPEKVTVTGHGETKSAMVLSSGMVCELRLVSDDQYPFLLHHSTGSKEHNTSLRQRAKKMNMTMNEYGLFNIGSNESIVCGDEEAIFNNLKLNFIPPELRENNGEIESAEQGEIPDLVSPDQLRGIFHVHTTHSDGAASISEMADACKKLGMDYIGITDHSKSAFYANGLTEDRVKKQHDEIDAINDKLKDFTIFKGIEADILPDGNMDFDDDVLASFDFVIASVHSSFNMSEEDMTGRICRALENPYVTMLGHPTGRLLLGREAYPVDMKRVIETAAKFGKIIEINANPYRLDLDWRWGRFANELGVKTSINPDAHAVEGLKDIGIGAGIARKGWFKPRSVFNTYPVEKIKSELIGMRG
ncbi:MAG: DNA polymerase/3'-5' exonuclease PolX [Calditrichaceae bacterium]